MLAPVGSAAGDVAAAGPNVVGDPAQPPVAGSDQQTPAPVDAAGSAADPAAEGLARISLATVIQDFAPARPAMSDGGSTVVMTARTPAPERPATPTPAAPATAPAGSGSTLRTGGDGGSAAAADVPAFQFSLTQISLKDVRDSSDELPGSVSLDHGFSPD